MGRTLRRDRRGGVRRAQGLGQLEAAHQLELEVVAGAVRRGAAVTGALLVAGAVALADEPDEPDELDEPAPDPFDEEVPVSTCT
jgi:hypothetical protein